MDQRFLVVTAGSANPSVDVWQRASHMDAEEADEWRRRIGAAGREDRREQSRYGVSARRSR